MMKKLLTMGLVLVCILTFAACSGSKKPKEYTKNENGIITDSVTVKFAYNSWDQSNIAWENVIEIANRNLEAGGSGVRIEGVKIPAADGWNDYYTKISTQIAAGKGPDIGEVAESLLPTMITKNMIIDITDRVNEDINMDDYFSATFEGSAYRDGRYYGIPSSNYYLTMYYNKDMFKEHNIPEPSKDWTNAITFDEVTEISKVLSTGSGADRTFGLSAGPYMGYIGMFSKSNGGDNVFDADGNCTLTSPQSLEVYKWFDTLLEDGSMPRPSDTTILSAADMFKAGKIAMIIDGSWAMSDFRSVEDFELGLAAVPSGEGQAYSSMFLNAFVIWKDNVNDDASWEALRAIYSEECWDELTRLGFCGVPINRNSLEKHKDDILGTNFSAEDTECFINGLDYTLKVPYNEYYEQADQEANNIMDEWLLGEIDYEEYANKVKTILENAKQKSEEERSKE